MKLVFDRESSDELASMLLQAADGLMEGDVSKEEVADLIAILVRVVVDITEDVSDFGHIMNRIANGPHGCGFRFLEGSVFTVGERGEFVRDSSFSCNDLFHDSSSQCMEVAS